ncbi:hypothetical protein L917_13788 [Phytophthora nicotianae]|uniref:Uncharacterized protein n=2 Tax=Phytophthora nicotianae TaxID=4792 RepID=W2PXF8_PHYN3|nr:hypothetical protein PPTG_23582 [Phytophthora nicotianae INRA-310]ETK80140.1 hypothetical protein L915_14103 [Phytophthora nicotianae]ETL86859.1 hypothetical protein L917_13788 [Phytophthora nicotianae]ETN04710.1 hypothetical protein PPTG_23582 [Phytophthora nicotianae INRA-310]
MSIDFKAKAMASSKVPSPTACPKTPSTGFELAHGC